MSEPIPNDPVGPTLSWHLQNAAIFVAFWFISFSLSVGAIVTLCPPGLRQSPVIALVPLFLILGLNVGAILLASRRASRKTILSLQQPEA